LANRWARLEVLYVLGNAETDRRPLDPTGPPGHTLSMDQEEIDYAEPGLPPPRQLPPLHIILALAGIALLAAMLVWALFSIEYPKVRN
jgi:hypothetical protein